MNIEYEKDKEIQHFRNKIDELENKRKNILKTLIEPIDNEIVMWRDNISVRRNELRR